jgi:hypothetical protein
MDQFERLKVDIEDSRADLQGNLRELERKVGDAADWRYQFQKRPAVLLGAAVAGGALLGMLVGPRRSPSIGRTLANESKPGSVSHSMMGDVVPQAWDNIKTALIGMAAARLQDVVEEVLPGFKHHYHAAEQRTTGFMRAT